MDWTVLGIKPTKDKKEITAAYRSLLSKTNPEDHPEEFKALRAAYEAALAYAKEPDAAETVHPEPSGPVDRWIRRVKDIYADDVGVKSRPKFEL